jgi:hypothetical protein
MKNRSIMKKPDTTKNFQLMDIKEIFNTCLYNNQGKLKQEQLWPLWQQNTPLIKGTHKDQHTQGYMIQVCLNSLIFRPPETTTRLQNFNFSVNTWQIYIF